MTTPARTVRPLRRLGLVLLTAAMLPAGAAAATAPAPDPALDQQVAGAETTVAEQAVVASGHVDVGPRFVDGTWQLQARDDRAVPPVWRAAEDTVLHVTDPAVLTVPDSPDYAFLGVPAGRPVHVVPQVQAPEVVWLGWNTQDPEVVQRLAGGASLTLHGADGPGEVTVFLQEGVAGAPNVLWDSAQPGPQDIFMETNTHVHANWVFTAPGVYALDVEAHATLADGQEVSDRSVLRFAVGDATDPAQAFAATVGAQPSAGATATPAGPADPAPAGPGPDAAPGAPEGLPTAVVGALVGAGAAVVLVAVGGTVLAARRRRAVVDAEFAARDDRSGGRR
jgi:putative ABC transporter-associated repeat protein